MQERRKYNIIQNLLTAVMIGIIGFFGSKIMVVLDNFPLMQRDIQGLKESDKKNANKLDDIIHTQECLRMEIEVIKNKINYFHKINKEQYSGKSDIILSEKNGRL